jgi:hypothetical protein
LKEDILQAKLYKWYTNTFCLKHHEPRHCIFSVPNGGYRKKSEAVTLRATGLLPGVSDLIIIQPKRIIFVEVKTEIGVQSDQQKAFEETVKYLGFEYYLVRSLEDLQRIITTHPDK